MDKMRLCSTVLFSLGSSAAFAQTSGTATPAPKAPTQENIVVEGARKTAAPTTTYERAPVYTPAGTPEPSVMPHSYCQSALQDDVGGQPGTSQTLTTSCP
jgi:hypothetical protein